MKKIKEMLTRNISLKILSFLLAALLWVSIMSINDPYITETIRNIKVEEIHNSVLEDKDYAVNSGDYVSITVKGKRSVVDNLKASDFVAQADFTELSIVNAVPIYVSLNPKASNYTEDDVIIQGRYPEMMTLTLEDLVEGIFKVDIETTGEVREGYHVTECIADRSNIQIKGTKKQLERIARVEVTVDIEDASKHVTRSVVPVVYDEAGEEIDTSNLKLEVSEMQVQVRIMPTKVISVMASRQGEPREGYEFIEFQYPSAMSAFASVTVAGTEEVLNSMSSYVIVPIDVTDMTESEDREVNLETVLKGQFPDLADEFTVISDKEIYIRTKIEKVITKELTVRASSIDIINLPDGLRARVVSTDGDVKFKIKGRENIIGDVSADTFDLYVDMDGNGIGTYTVSLLCDTKAEVAIVSQNVVVEVFDTINY